MASSAFRVLWLQAAGCGGCAMPPPCAKNGGAAPSARDSSPRNAGGIRGPLEPAHVGAPVAAGKYAPAAVQHGMRSFDPCVVGTVHRGVEPMKTLPAPRPRRHLYTALPVASGRAARLRLPPCPVPARP